jgi:hypothetical protein
MASIHLAQLHSRMDSRSTFWYSFFDSQHNNSVLIPKNSSDLGHYFFDPRPLTVYPVYSYTHSCGCMVTYWPSIGISMSLDALTLVATDYALRNRVF